MTLDEFLTWEAQQLERFEFLDGKPIPLPDSTQERSLLITDIVAGLKRIMCSTDRRVLVGIRIPIPELGEVRYPAIVIDAGPYRPQALEPSQPVVIIDIDGKRDWSALSGAQYLSVDVDASPDEVLTLIKKRTD